MPANAIIQLRSGTAAQWSSANPTLAAGEMGYESDTGQLKIGNGTTSWSSLAYGGPIGPAQTQTLENFGDGSDGNVVISSGMTTLTRDMYYNNLTITGTGILYTKAYRVFVFGTLNIATAGSSAINFNGNNGTSTATTGAGAAGAALTTETIGGAPAGGAGEAGGAANTAGTNGANSAAGAVQNGGSGGNGGAGGEGNSVSGGNGGNGGNGTVNLPIRRWEIDLLLGVTVILGGSSGGGGGSGGGGSATGGGSGGGGSAGGVLAIYANNIARGNGYIFTITAGQTASVGATFTNNSQTFTIVYPLISSATTLYAVGTGAPSSSGTLTYSSGTASGNITFSSNSSGSTSTNCITSNGGNGGNGGTPVTGTNESGGGGGGGAGGGWVFICYNNLIGSSVTNAISASGGNGGNGGNGNGTGGNGTGGTGGNGGNGGRIFTLQVTTGTGSQVTGSSGTAGSGPTGTNNNTGGSGGAGNTLQMSL